MKALKLVTLILLTLSNMTFQACAKDKNGHTLTKLWAEYEKAVDADKPKDQADILDRIKKEATVQKLPWDFYDASWKYVQARTSTNWKLREELTAQANKDIEAFGEPVAVFFNRKDRGSTTELLLAYVQEQKARLQQTKNPEFWDADSSIGGYSFSEVLKARFANDYDYALWSLLTSRRSGAADAAAREYFAGRYPFEALVEFVLAQHKTRDEAKKRMQELVDQYGGTAFSLLPREYLLSIRQNELRWEKGTSEQYRQLALDCETFLADQKRFTGDEKAIADCCTEVEDIFATLTQ